MAEKQIVAAEVSVKVTGKEDIKDLNKDVKEVNESLKDTGTTAKKTGKEIQDSTGHFGKLKNTMGDLPGPLGAASSGVKTLSTAFKALLANPVGLVILAIVGALALLYKAFTNSFAGAQKLEQAFAGLKAVVQAFIDNITKLAGALVKLFKFDFSGAVADIKGVANEAGAAYSQMVKLTEKSQQLKKEQLANDLDQAKREKDLAVLREQATDESIPLKERIGLLKDLQKQARENAVDDNRRAKEFAENEIAKLTIQKEGALKNNEEITKLKIDQIKVDTDNANELRRIGKQITAAEKQEAAEQKAIHDKKIADSKALTAAQKEAEKERLAIQERSIEAARKQAKTDIENAGLKIKQLEEEKIKAELLATQARGKIIDPKLIEAQNAVLANDIIKQSEKEKTEFVITLAQREAEAKQTLYNAVSGALGTLSDIVGKQSAAGKVLAIAQTTIDTYQAGFAAFKGMVTTIPGPVGIALGVVAAAGALASGIAAVKKIIAVKLPGSGGAGGSAPGAIPLPAAPVAPAQTSTTLDQASLSGIGNAATGRVYVLDQDVANNRDRNERLNRAARLG